MNADKHQTSNDVIHSKAHTAQKANAFCQTRINNQSLSYIPTYKSSTSITSIQSKSVNSSIYKSSIKSSNSNFSVKSSNCNLSLSNYKSTKINSRHSRSNPQFYIPQPLTLTHLFLHLILHFQNLKKFLLQREITRKWKLIYNQFKNEKEPRICLK